MDNIFVTNNTSPNAVYEIKIAFLSQGQEKLLLESRVSIIIDKLKDVKSLS
jgi:hypothetical protein